jgi:hypothetical protein
VKVVTYKAHFQNGKPERLKIESDYSAHEKNFITHYDEKGQCIREILWGTEGKHIKEYENGQHEKNTFYKPFDKVYQVTIHKFNDASRPVETVVTNADGTLYYRVVNTYRDDGKQLTHLHTRGVDERILNRTVYSYNEKGNLLSIIQYKEDGTIDHKNLYEYNEQGKQIDSITEYTDSDKKKYRQRITQIHVKGANDLKVEHIGCF